MYLPPYSSDFNPIEEAFSALKAWIQRNRDYVNAKLTGEVDCDPYKMLWCAVFKAVNPDKAQGWFSNSGYM